MASDSPSASQNPVPQGPLGDAGTRHRSRPLVRMGRYEVVKHIATGGMGTVYRARDTLTGRDVALKVLRPEMAAKQVMLERFKREARSAEKLRHENVVALLECGEAGGTHFMAMEFVDGTDLHDHTRKNGPLDPEEAREIILQGARALRAANEHNIVHRDVKPSNFLLTRRDGCLHVKLTDFGLAHDFDSDQFRLTRTGTTVGTVDYMAPEQARDSGAADIRSDLYSLGCTWFHLLTGQAPFPEGGLGERLVKLMQEPPPDVRDLNPDVSDETWEVMERLLAKNPADRYQTPDELIGVLLTLEGRSSAGPRRRPPARTGQKRQVRADSAAPSTAFPDEAGKKALYVMAVLVCLLLVGGITLIANMPRQPRDDGPREAIPAAPEERIPTLVPANREAEKGGGRAVRTLPDTGGTIEPLPPVPVRVAPLVSSRPLKEEDVQAQRKAVLAPWDGLRGPPSGTPVLRVRRGIPGLGEFRSLADACRAAPPGSAIIEIHDNGPLYERPAGVLSGRDVTIRAASGYRPLIVWDLPGTAEKGRGKPDQPVVFLKVDKGRLTLEGLEIVWRWPEVLARPAVLLDLDGADLDVRDCVLSGAGHPKAGVAVARCRNAGEGARCRFTRCHVRGAGLTALDLAGPGTEVLFDGCLVAGGQEPLLRLRAGKKGPRLRLVRSTLVGGSRILVIRPDDGEFSPAVSCLCWDSLLSHAGGTGGAMVELLGRAEVNGISWQAVNSVYAGWDNLLTGPVTAADVGDWRRRFGRFDSDTSVRPGWPEHAYPEPAAEPAAAYTPSGAVRFGATVRPDALIGCDLSALPAGRDNWIAVALEPPVALAQMITDDAPPPVPAEGVPYHGETINLDGGTDLGAYLSRKRLGPKVVLHLTGRGRKTTSPIWVKGSSLVLHFAEPAEKEAPRLELEFGRASDVEGGARGPGALVQVEKGSLEIINGALRVPDATGGLVTHVVRVDGGDLRLYRTTLAGPQLTEPEGYLAAAELVGSGDPAAGKAHECGIRESVLLSSLAGVVLQGVGCRLRIEQSVVVAGTDGVQLLPGDGCRGRVNQQCSLSRVTVAARRSVVRLGEAMRAGIPAEPAQVQASACAYLNPFPGARAGVLSWEGDALPRGLLVWQGEREGFDRRLYHAASGRIPDVREGWTGWKQLWGSAGVRQPRELLAVQAFDARRWPLERLYLKMPDPPGANLERLGLLPKRKR